MNHRIMRTSGLLASGFFAGIVLLSCIPLRADEQFSGHFELGIREVNITGDKYKYKQHLNLESGARVFALGFKFRPENTDGMKPDRAEFDATGLGGDPYQNISVAVQKYGAYQFGYQHQKSDYFYQDILFDSIEEDHAASIAGDFHTFDYERLSDKAFLNLQMSDRGKFMFAFDRTHKSGESTTVLDVSREEFEMEKPIDETTENIDVGVEYTWDKVSVEFHERWRELDNAASVFLQGASVGSSPTGPTQLNDFFLGQSYAYDSREHQITITAKPATRWQIKADVLIAKLDMDINSAEDAQGTDFSGAPLNQFVEGVGGADRDTRQFYLSSAYTLTDRVRITASLREQHLEQEALISFDPLNDQLNGNSDWDIDSSRVTLGIEAQIATRVTLGGGWLSEKRKVDYLQSSVQVSDMLDENSRSNGFWFKARYRPGKFLDLGISVEDDSIDDAFTLTSPTDVQRYRLSARLRWNDSWSLSATQHWRDRKNSNSDWKYDSSQTDFRLSHNSERLALSLGASFVDLNYNIDQIVTAGFRQDLFPIVYKADTDSWDGSARWRFTDRFLLSASYRDYKNKGSFRVAREDVRVALEFDIPRNYSLKLGFHNTDYKEEPLEAFDSEVWEIALRRSW